MSRTPLYTYRLQGRRPMTAVGFLISISMFTIGFRFDAPCWWLAGMAMTAGLMAWQWIGNQLSGSDVTADAVRLYVGRNETIVPVANIRSVRVKRWMEGAPSITLLLYEGKPVSVSQLHVDGGFLAVLNELGLPEEAV